MANPFNPIDWLKSAQNWFSKTEKSSGFRPYLIFLILVFGMSICLLTFFHEIKYVPELSISMISLSVIVFLILYSVKSCTDPDFCRSESHVQKIMKIELECMGTEAKQIDGDILETQLVNESYKEKHKLLTTSINHKEVE